MERLIADANKVKEANGEMADLSIESFADITEAIHIIQTEMGITGTTSLEAEKTITGSINAMKGAFDNFLNGTGGADALVETITNVFNNVSDALIEMLPTLVDGIVQLVNALAPKIPEIIKKLMPSLIDGVLDITKGLVKALPQIIDALISSISTIIMAIAEALPDMIPTIIDALIEGLLSILENVDLLIECGLKLVMGLITGIIIEGIPKIIEMAPQIIVGIVTGLISALGKIIEIGANIISSLWDGICSMFSQLWEWIKSIPENIFNWLWDGLKSIADIGVRIVEGIWDGICSVANWLWDKISGFFEDIWDGICDFFGINSPSKLFEEGLGQYIPQGLAIGIETNLDSVEDAIDDMNGVVMSAFDLQPDISNMGSTYSPETEINVYNSFETDPLGQMVANVKTFSGGAKNDYNWGAGV